MIRADDFASFPLLRELESDEREALFEVIQRRELDAGATLFEEGQPSDGLVLVVRGELRLESRRAGPLGVVGSGSALGACALAGPGRRESTAVAASGARVLVLTRDGLRGLAQTEPRAAYKLVETVLRTLADDLRQGLHQLAEGLGRG